jgi:hypothetical protein
VPKKTTASKPSGKAPDPKPSEPITIPQQKPGKVRDKIYEAVEVNGIPVPAERVVLTYDQVKAIMGWETEEEYAARRVKEGFAKALIQFGDDYLLLDEYDKKVRCSHNSTNRPFDAGVAKSYRQDHLHRKFLFNGEAFIVDEFGDVISGQHRGAGFILAVQAWRKDPYWKKFWPEEPVYRTILVCGVPGTQEVRATLDNVRPRQLSDTIYTSDTFSDLDAKEKRECSRMMDYCVDLLWKRTGAGFSSHMGKQTNQASHDFLSRHPKVVEAVRHLFTQNKERGISLKKLSPGQCAAMMYLMAASGSDGKKYRESDPPSEKNADLRYWGKAKDFWSLLAGNGAALVPLINVLSKMLGGNYGTRELNDKKLASVVKAWNLWSAGQKLTLENVAPDCLDLGTEECRLDPDKMPVCGGETPDHTPVGLDLGCRPEQEDDGESAEEVEKRKEELARKAAGTPQATGAVAETLKRCRGLAPKRLLLFANSEGGFTAFDEDADVLAAVLGSKPTARPDGLRHAKAPKGDPMDLASMLRVKGGKQVSVVAEDGKTITDLHPPVRAKTPEAPAPAPAAANGKAPPAPAANGEAPKGPNGKGKLKLRGGIGSAG